MIRTHVAFNLVQYCFRFCISSLFSVRWATLFIILYTHFTQLSEVLMCNIRLRYLHCDYFGVHNHFGLIWLSWRTKVLGKRYRFGT